MLALYATPTPHRSLPAAAAITPAHFVPCLLMKEGFFACKIRHDDLPYKHYFVWLNIWHTLERAVLITGRQYLLSVDSTAWLGWPFVIFPSSFCCFDLFLLFCKYSELFPNKFLDIYLKKTNFQSDMTLYSFSLSSSAVVIQFFYF